MTIHILEDSALEYMILSKKLPKGGYDPQQLIKYKWLRDLLKASVSVGDIILSDLHVPDSNGIETVYKIKEHFPDNRIIAHTGSLLQEFSDQDRARFEFLIKGEYETPDLVKFLSNGRSH